MVFFTAKGVPGEVDEGMDSVKGAIAACARAMRNTAHAAGAGRYTLRQLCRGRTPDAYDIEVEKLRPIDTSRLTVQVVLKTPAAAARTRPSSRGCLLTA